MNEDRWLSRDERMARLRAAAKAGLIAKAPKRGDCAFANVLCGNPAVIGSRYCRQCDLIQTETNRKLAHDVLADPA